MAPWTAEVTQSIQSSPQAAPTGLTASEVSDSSVSLSWTTPSGEITGYRVLRGLTAAKQDVLENNSGSTETGYVDSDVEAETQYHYSVRAINDAGVGPASETISVTTKGQAVDPKQGNPPGTVTLTPAQPHLGIPITASLTDPDIPVSAEVWQWSKADTYTETGFTNITDATSATYRPVEADIGKFLKASVIYTDSRAAGNHSSKRADSAVSEEKTTLIEAISGNNTVYGGPHGVSQGFITGGNPQGYKLSTVTMLLTTGSSSTALKIFTSTTDTNLLSRVINEELYTLTHQSTSGYHRTFAAPTGARLAPDTTYHVVAVPAGSGSQTCVGKVNNNESGAQDWSIIDYVLYVDSNEEPADVGYSDGSCGLRITGKAAKNGPYITEISYATNPATAPTYDTGETITVAVTFSEAITPDTNNSPAIPLKVGSNTRNATYAAGSADKLEFHYTVVAADQDNDGITIEQNSMTGNVLKTGGTGVVADLDHNADSNNPDQRVNAAPTITSIRYTSTPVAPRWYTAGETIEITATFSLPIIVTGDPKLRFEIGTGSASGADRDATYVATASSTNTMVFQYTVLATDEDTDGIFVDHGNNTILLDADDSIKDGIRAMGKKDAILTHGTVGGGNNHNISQLPRLASLRVTSDPKSGSGSDTYGTGEKIEFTATFNQDITVTGNPQHAFSLIDANIGTAGERRVADHQDSLSTARTAVFTYRVLATDSDDDGIYLWGHGVGNTSFVVDSENTIKNSANADAVLDYPNHRTQSGHKVDGSLAGPNTQPAFPDDNPPDGADPITMTVVENSPSRTAVGRADAEDQDGDFSIYSVVGTDASAFDQVFTLDTVRSIIRVKTGAIVDYESKASYSITLNVTDGEDASGNPETPATIDDTVAVTINVTDLEEDGVVALSRATPSVGVPITATLTDSDGGITNLAWQWAKSDTETGSFTDISRSHIGFLHTPQRRRSEVAQGDGVLHRPPGLRQERRTDRHQPGGYHAPQGTGVRHRDDNPHGRGECRTTASGRHSRRHRRGWRHVVPHPSGHGQRPRRIRNSIQPEHQHWGNYRQADHPARLSKDETKASYSVTVQVSDREDLLGNPETPATIDDTITVTINVTDLDESGAIDLTGQTPVIGTPYTATLVDYDGAVTDVAWQWSRGNTREGNFTNISGATSASYTPVDADLSKYLKVTASYTDGHGPGKSHENTSSDVVIDTPYTVPAFPYETETRSIDENSPRGTILPHLPNRRPRRRQPHLLSIRHRCPDFQSSIPPRHQ